MSRHAQLCLHADFRKLAPEPRQKLRALVARRTLGGMATLLKASSDTIENLISGGLVGSKTIDRILTILETLQ